MVWVLVRAMFNVHANAATCMAVSTAQGRSGCSCEGAGMTCDGGQIASSKQETQVTGWVIAKVCVTW